MIDVTSLPLFNNWQLCNYKKKVCKKEQKKQLSATETTLYLNTNISTPTLNSATHVHVLIQAPYYFFLSFLESVSSTGNKSSSVRMSGSADDESLPSVAFTSGLVPVGRRLDKHLCAFPAFATRRRLWKTTATCPLSRGGRSCSIG